jgi:molybdopterin-binding protein
MENVKPKDAADLIGVSYPTVKQWIYDGKIRSVKTPGGHHRIPLSEVQRIAGTRSGHAVTREDSRRPPEQISVRNQLVGVITGIIYDGFFAEVTVDVGGQLILSIITRQGCEEMGLKVGMKAYALFKATEVMISRR